MDLSNKKFRDNKTGEVIKVIDSFENIAILENKQKVQVNRLMDLNIYTEIIDPTSFFNNQNSYNILAEKIKNISTENIKDDITGEVAVSPDRSDIRPMTDESAVILTSEEDERAELARKYGVNTTNVESMNKQNDAFAKLLGDDADLPKVKQIFIEPEPEIQRIEIDRDTNTSQIINQHDDIPSTKQKNIENPMMSVFKGIKKVVDFKMQIEISNKIPRLDFIEMMEDSYESSIIDFLAGDLTNKMLSDPANIRAKIKEKLTEMVYKNSQSKKEPKKKIAKKPIAPKTQIIKEGIKPKSKIKQKANDI